MLKLMLRLYDPTKGTISVNGKGIKTLELVELRESMAAPFRDYTQFPSTALKSEMSFHGLVADKKALVRNRSRITLHLGILRMHMVKAEPARRPDLKMRTSMYAHNGETG